MSRGAQLVQENTTRDTQEQLLHREREIKSKIPYKAPIFLPTEVIPLEERVRGLERVLTIWEHDWPKTYSPQLQELRKRYLGQERCFIIGNGPSLNKTNLELLKNEVCFGVNSLFLKFPEMEFRPTFYVVEDHLVAEDRRQEINALTGVTKLFPINLAYCFEQGPSTLFFNHRPRVRYPDAFDFSTDASKITYAGCTVTFTCMQLAFYLGFQKIYLIGVDFNYDLPKDVQQSNDYGVSVLDMNSDDPNHFHPDYFGKGRRWHDPQVEQMGKAYEEARRVTDSYGVEILNATVGGKLEVFPRVDYPQLFAQAKAPQAAQRIVESPVSPPVRESSAERERSVATYPRVLLFDISRMGGYSATGQMKKNLFSGWPHRKLMQVYVRGPNTFGIYRGGQTNDTDQKTTDPAVVLSACQAFAPDVIYYRPVDSQLHLHELACQAMDQFQVPLVTHIVDDWPQRLQHQDPKLYQSLDRSLRDLLKKSTHCLSICDAMSVAFQERYGVDFTAAANCIHPDEWFVLNGLRKYRRSVKQAFVIRYIGALAEDMCFQSVADMAHAVDELNRDSDLDIQLEIYTRAPWKGQALKAFGELNGVSIHDSGLSQELYRKLLVGCDALLIAYNFSQESIEYVRYSMANKLPECLASAVPVVVYGPMAVATVAYAAQTQVAELITEPDPAALRAAIQKLALDPEYGRTLGKRAQAFALEHFSSERIGGQFHTILQQAAARRQGTDAVRVHKLEQPGTSSIGLVGVYGRAAHAQLDETGVVAELVRGEPGGGIMVDVGAHRGASLTPFVKQGWQVVAFEPDGANRAALVQRFGRHPQMEIDVRAVSDEVAAGVQFYTSAESTGISGLSAFTAGHEPTGVVATTTIGEVMRERGLERIDFLKIDTEGYDLMVLKGVPWEAVQPRVIVCEFEDRKTVPLGYRYEELAEYLVARGYTVLVSEWHPIIRYGIKHDWRRLAVYPCELGSREAWGNLLAFRAAPDLEQVAAVVQRLVKTAPEAVPVKSASLPTPASHHHRQHA